MTTTDEARANYRFVIVSPKYGRFWITAPRRFKDALDAIPWHILYDRDASNESRFSVGGYEYLGPRNTRCIRLHRLIWVLGGRAPVAQIDHIDRNPLNNAESNLRDGSVGNSRNRPRQRNNRSGCPGVYMDKVTGHWKVQVCANGKHYHIGTFRDFNHARNARNEAARRLHGEFAVIAR